MAWIGYRRRALAAYVATAVGFAALGGGGVLAAHSLIAQPGPLLAARDVVIPRGGLTEVTDTLLRTGVIDNRWTFRLATWMTWGEGPVRAAELSFPRQASLRTVLAVLRTGRPVQHLLTLPEGLTSQQLATLVNNADAMTGEVKPPLEGSVLPQTYAYEYGMARSALMARAEAAMTRELASLWENRAPGLPLGSMQDAVTLASIVEKETARPDERSHVAGVYINRLRSGMRLQADPTVVYAASGGEGVLDRKLNRADLEMASPYNTYRVTGLPPGPICAPGLASIQAVLHPKASDDLYFVADGSGGHAFSRTHEGHARNVAAWRALNAGASNATGVNGAGANAAGQARGTAD